MGRSIMTLVLSLAWAGLSPPVAAGPATSLLFPFPEIAETFTGLEHPTVLEWGDYDGNGLIDIAIGSPFSRFFPEVQGAGAVDVYLRQPGGAVELVTYFRSDFFNGDGREINDHFGHALAAGDYNCDGQTDLAIGTPGAEVEVGGLPTAVDAGEVFVVFGPLISLPTLDDPGLRFLQADSPEPAPRNLLLRDPADNHRIISAPRVDRPLPGIPETGDQLGFALAAGDPNGDGCNELIIGIPGDKVGEFDGAGSIVILPSTTLGGLDNLNALVIDQSRPDLTSTVEAFDRFGESLVTADFLDGSNIPFDLAVGAPGEDLVSDTVVSGGAVFVLIASGEGETIEFEGQRISRFQPETAGTPLAFEQFGKTLAAGDINCDGPDDLLVSSPGSTPGRLQVFPSGDNAVDPENPTPLDNYLMAAADLPTTQGTFGFPNRFGAVMALTDLDNDGCDDLLLGDPGSAVTGQLAYYFGQPEPLIETPLVDGGFVSTGGLGLTFTGDIQFPKAIAVHTASPALERGEPLSVGPPMIAIAAPSTLSSEPGQVTFRFLDEVLFGSRFSDGESLENWSFVSPQPDPGPGE